MSSEPAVRVNRVSKEYKLGLTGRTTPLATIARERLRHPIKGGQHQRERFLALDEVTFDVMAGEVLAVIGRNGAGKSTLLKILSRITRPSGGSVDLVGNVGSLLEVGTGFHPELTGMENVYLNGTILGMTKRQIDARLEEIVDFAEVHQFLETPVKRYSSGMRVRLAFAVAAHLEPEVLIIDEVLSVGDTAFQTKCIDKMRAVANDDGRTVLYVSHNLVTVETLCPRSLLLVDGQLAFDGPTPETLALYLHDLPHAERGATVGVFDLAAADRSVQGYEKVFHRLELRSRGVATETVRMCDPMQIEITVNGLDALPDGVVMVSIGSGSTDSLVRMSSRMRPLDGAHERRSEEKIVLDIPSLALMPGEYHVDVRVGTKPQLGRGTFDEVHRAAEFSVIAADVYGNGYLLTHNDGQLVMPWDWELRPASVEAEALVESE